MRSVNISQTQFVIKAMRYSYSLFKTRFVQVLIIALCIHKLIRFNKAKHYTGTCKVYFSLLALMFAT